MNISNIDNKLKDISKDDDLGVELALLTGDEKMSIFALELQKGEFIHAHYHKEDIETYFILNGEGVVFLGTKDQDGVIWESEDKVHKGDCFTIYPHQVHKFKNLSSETLRIIATAPLSHSEEDRYFVNDKD
ncbi:MAG: cupin domain-containing protein [Sporocytophaga sp.]|uniref:cupin domain-containing protein n=1 Tax=Sporocytophaga sp. TaxID=2231183 RepID=UPI001B272E7A|nr:cupin domain-containing protein [Sporocytophaga sp.]MBO9703632.1 cupin domain-containing protein [Sporocytophaga sp.]